MNKIILTEEILMKLINYLDKLKKDRTIINGKIWVINNCNDLIKENNDYLILTFSSISNILNPVTKCLSLFEEARRITGFNNMSWCYTSSNNYWTKHYTVLYET